MKTIAHLGLCILLLSATGALRAAGPETVEAGLQAEAMARLFKPVPGKAVIYLVRDRGDVWTQDVVMYLDGREMGASEPMSYFRWEVEPGAHVIAADTIPPAVLEVSTEPGGLYYVWQDINPGHLRAPTALRLVDQTTARTTIATSVLLQSRP
jgi:hypothetical protein